MEYVLKKKWQCPARRNDKWRPRVHATTSSQTEESRSQSWLYFWPLCVLVRGHDFVKLTTRCTKSLVAALRGRTSPHVPAESGGNVNWWTIVFLYKAVSEEGGMVNASDGRLAQEKSLLQNNPTMPFCACVHDKERSIAHIGQPHSPLWPWCTCSLLGFCIRWLVLHNYLFLLSLLSC